MRVIYPSKKQRIHITAAVLPLLLFILLRLVPAWDLPIWRTIWYSRLVHFYVMAFVSFMAFVTGLFATTALRTPLESRVLFIRMAFIALAVFSLLNSISTPGVLFTEIDNESVKWSARMGLFLTAVFFALATIRWPTVWERRFANYRLAFWLGSGVLYILFAGLTFQFPELWSQLDNFDPPLKYVMTSVTIFLFAWSVRHSWRLYRQAGQLVEGRLVIFLLLLAEAQISQVFGVWGQLSWQLYGFIILIALAVALSAVLSAFYSRRDLQPAHYIAVLGSILIVGLALAGGELARWLTSGVQRRFIVSLTLIQGTLSFIIMYALFWRLNQIVEERTEALKREQKLRNELTRLIVHDLKNPLMVVTEGAKLLNRGHLGALSEQQKGLLQRMGQSGHNTLHLIDDLLDVERLEAGAIELQPAPLDLWQMLGNAVANFQVLAAAHDQSLRLRLTTKLPVIEADTQLMRRVFDNVIGNALKFSPDNGRIEVSARLEGAYVVIDVIDSGPGVLAINRTRIFEKFSQVHSSERRGAGLGLTFCKMTVERHGGTIIVKDSPLGGALFRITLPISVKPPLAEENESQVSNQQPAPHPATSTLQTTHF